MKLDPQSLSTREMYQWMVQLITPRPIAWVSTESSTGVANLAPFSFFNGVGANPPTIMFCPANARDGSPKDTLRNIQQTGQFAVNLVSFADAESMNQTAVAYAPDEDEFVMASINKATCDLIDPPRVAQAIVAMECQSALCDTGRRRTRWGKSGYWPNSLHSRPRRSAGRIGESGAEPFGHHRTHGRQRLCQNGNGR